MIRRWGALAILAGVFSGACASAGLPVYGNWQVIDYKQPGGGPLSSVQSLSWIGTSATLTRKDVRFGVLRCYSPTYTSQTLTATDFSSQYKIAPTEVGITGDSISLYKVECPKDPSLKSLDLIVRGSDSIVIPFDNKFFELQRRETTR